MLEWRDFWRTFQPLIDREKSLSDAEKIAHLLASMTGECALKEAKIAAGAYEKYKEVVAQLKSKFDQPRTVYHSHIRQLCKVKIVQYTRNGLSDALSHLDIHYNGLQRHEGAMLEQFLPVFSEECLAKWNEYTSTTKTPPTLEQLRKFLQGKADTLSDDIKPSSSGAGRLKDRPKPSVLDIQDNGQECSSSNVCAFCKSSHPLHQCKIFPWKRGGTMSRGLIFVSIAWEKGTTYSRAPAERLVKSAPQSITPCYTSPSHQHKMLLSCKPRMIIRKMLDAHPLA